MTDPSQPTALQLSLADLRAKIIAASTLNDPVKDDDGNILEPGDPEAADRVEKMTAWQSGNDVYLVDNPLPTDQNYIIVAMWEGDQNDRILANNQGDKRIYVAPLAAAKAGEKKYRRVIMNMLIGEIKHYPLTLEQFVEACGYELLMAAVKQEGDEEEPEPELEPDETDDTAPATPNNTGV